MNLSFFPFPILSEYFPLPLQYQLHPHHKAVRAFLRYCYVVTFVNRVNGIKSLFLSLMSEDIRKEPWMLVFPALTTLLYEDWLPTG